MCREFFRQIKWRSNQDVQKTNTHTRVVACTSAHCMVEFVPFVLCSVDVFWSIKYKVQLFATPVLNYVYTLEWWYSQSGQAASLCSCGEWLTIASGQKLVHVNAEVCVVLTHRKCAFPMQSVLYYTHAHVTAIEEN